MPATKETRLTGKDVTHLSDHLSGETGAQALTDRSLTRTANFCTPFCLFCTLNEKIIESEKDGREHIL